ncbi:MAG TPA: TIGR03936 family radical SAM-associated protein [Oscillospiraceae bacterium]|nr:TIGR03936 family radical SAM-associated protein [Oscillospiraceae bacterium]HNW03952.1 TIGR03936 family radical SAM-associated protein [Oscillospiraceae bacterium]HPV99647.1 TIGR03936 family radical SAM-associated protein [Oscillospiraceae bacterium]
MSDAQNFTDVRLFYTKTGSAKYISHLDVMRAFQRALKRTKIGVWYTEGFHPHLYLNFALPLSLGYESLCECVDFRLLEDIPFEELAARVGAALPAGFGVVSAGAPVMKVSEIHRADYEIAFSCPGHGEEEARAAWKGCFDRPEIPVLKKTKRGERVVDLRPEIEISALSYEDGRFRFRARLAAGCNETVNPALLFDAFSEFSGLPADDISVTRTAVYRENGEIFR